MFVHEGLTYIYEIKLWPSLAQNGDIHYTNSIYKAEAKYEEYSWSGPHMVLRMHDNTMDYPKILRQRS